jgi:NitT/TauT family transport system permease protein
VIEVRRTTLADRAAAAFVFVSALAVWEAIARTGLISPVFFPPPTRIVIALAALAGGRLWPHLGATLARVIAGSFCGCAIGLVLGLVMGRSERLRSVLEPFVAAAHPVPKIALLPLAMLLLGLGEASKITLVAIAAFFPMVVNTTAGVRLLNPIHLEVARNYGARGLRLYRRVILPGSLPMILTGVRLALNVALLLGVAIELVAGQTGLGRLIWFSWQTLRTEELYATLLVTAALGVGFHLAVHALEQRLIPWMAPHA